MQVQKRFVLLLFSSTINDIIILLYTMEPLMNITLRKRLPLFSDQIF